MPLHALGRAGALGQACTGHADPGLCGADRLAHRAQFAGFAGIGYVRWHGADEKGEHGIERGVDSSGRAPPMVRHRLRLPLRREFGEVEAGATDAVFDDAGEQSWCHEGSGLTLNADAECDEQVRGVGVPGAYALVVEPIKVDERTRLKEQE